MAHTNLLRCSFPITNTNPLPSGPVWGNVDIIYSWRATYLMLDRKKSGFWTGKPLKNETFTVMSQKDALERARELYEGKKKIFLKRESTVDTEENSDTVTPMKRFKGKTPNALPPTMITLGTDFNCGSLSRDAVLKVTHITCMTIGDKSSNNREGKKAGHYPYHLIDLQTADDRIFARSRDLRITKKELLKRMRALTRKVAMFQFENR